MTDKLSPNDAKWVADARRQFIERVDGPVIAALRARVAKLEDALRFLFEETKWKSADKDNMEFEGRVTCYQLDKARAALKDAPQ